LGASGMINQKTKDNMKTYKTNGDKLTAIELQWTELVTSEISAFERLERFEQARGNYTPLMIREEILRRRKFFEELLREL
jgi:hypothetical protein